jgi:hypothetical protein
MTKIQLAEFRTLRQVFRYLEESQDLCARVPVIAVQHQVLGTRLSLIETLTREQEADKTGLRLDKTRLGEELVNGIMRLAGPLSAWAALNQQYRVLAQCDFTPGALRKLNAERLVAEGKTVSELCTARLDQLSDYGVNGDVVSALDSQISAYDELATAPHAGISRTVALTALLAKEVDAGMELLRRFFDRIVYVFQADQPAFFATYQAYARVIRLPAGRRPSDAVEAVETPTPAEAPVAADSGNDQEEATAEEVEAVLHETAPSTPIAPEDAGARNGSGHLADLTS